MNRGASEIEIEAALRNPTGCFKEPQDVAEHPQLSREDKLAILRRWKEDALRLSASEAEGMGGGEESMLGRVERAIQTVAKQS
jgi:hypothetical protein